MLPHPRADHDRSTAVPRSAPLLLVLAGSAALLAACGGSGTPASSGTSATPVPQPTKGQVSATTVTATETEFAINLSQTSLPPGSYTFQTSNAGKFPHALTIDGPGVQNQATPTLAPGQAGSVTVAFQTGTYTVYCPVDGHRGKGMQTQITVAPGAGASTSSAPDSSPATGSGGGGGY
jgi:plastocyanin